jgi:hypothetical protein
MQRARIDTDAAAEWARQISAEADRHERPLTDEELQAYWIAHGIVVDGIYQDLEAIRSDVDGITHEVDALESAPLRWQFWKQRRTLRCAVLTPRTAPRVADLSYALRENPGGVLQIGGSRARMRRRNAANERPTPGKSHAI